MGLRRIVLRDFVIVSELELEFADGFTVLTGETGAGKSILIDALQLVTGARADVGVIREGAVRTDVSAEFDCTDAVGSWQGSGNGRCFRVEDGVLRRMNVASRAESGRRSRRAIRANNSWITLNDA